MPEIDIRDVNNLGASEFRIGVENYKEKTCYFNYNKKDRVFNRFLAVRKKTPDREIVFSTVKLKNKSNKSEDIYYNLGDKLRKFVNVRIQPEQRIRKVDKTEIRDQHLTEEEKNNATIMRESAKNWNFFQNKNAILKKENNKPYTTIRIKSRVFLSNISYVDVNEEDFYNKGFTFDVYSLVVKNLNPFSLERKTSD